MLGSACPQHNGNVIKTAAPVSGGALPLTSFLILGTSSDAVLFDSGRNWVSERRPRDVLSCAGLEETSQTGSDSNEIRPPGMRRRWASFQRPSCARALPPLAPAFLRTQPESSWRSQIMSIAGQCSRASPEKRDQPPAILVGRRQGDQSEFPAGNSHGRHSYAQATLSSPESGEEGPPKANWPQSLALP